MWCLRSRAWRWGAIGGGTLLGETAAFVLLASSTYSSGFASYQIRWLWALAALHWSATGLLALAWGQARRAATSGAQPLRQLRRLDLGAMVTATVLIVTVVALAGTLRPPADARATMSDRRLRMATIEDLAQPTVDFAAEHAGTQLIVGTGPDQPAISLDLAAQVLLAGEEITISSPDPQCETTSGPNQAPATAARRSKLRPSPTDRSCVVGASRSWRGPHP